MNNLLDARGLVL